MMFGMPASGCPSFAISGFAVDFAIFCALLARCPMHVSDFEVAVRADQTQDLSGRTAAQVIPEYREGGKPKLDSAGAVILPLRILGILASSFGANIGDILSRTARAMQPGAAIAKDSHSGRSLSFRPQIFEDIPDETAFSPTFLRCPFLNPAN